MQQRPTNMFNLMYCVGNTPGGSTRHRQNLFGQSHGGRGRHPLLQRQRGRVCGDVPGRGGCPHQGPVQGGPCQCTLHHIHRSVIAAYAVPAGGVTNVFVVRWFNLYLHTCQPCCAWVLESSKVTAHMHPVVQPMCIMWYSSCLAKIRKASKSLLYGLGTVSLALKPKVS